MFLQSNEEVKMTKAKSDFSKIRKAVSGNTNTRNA
jgi:hypothetical protein